MTRINAKEHYRSFTGEPQSVAVARDWVVQLLRGSTASEDACWKAALITSELATNSVRHSDSGAKNGQFSVWVFISHTFARIEIRDAGNAASVPQVVQGRTSSGHGLALVENMARSSGTQRRKGYQATYAEVCWKRHSESGHADSGPGQSGHRRFHDDTLPEQPTHSR